MQNNLEKRRVTRVLLLAESANPEWASVPLIGWSLSRAISKLVDVHVVTQVRNTEAFLRAGLVERKDFTAIDNESVVSPLFKISEKLRGGAGKGWTTSTAFSSLAYYSFELKVWHQFQSRIIAREFDLVHRITPVSPTSPSIIAKRLASLNIPFVIGPLNGGVPWPRAFAERQRAERDWLFNLRWMHEFMPAFRSTRRYASAIIVGSKHTLSEMPSWTSQKCVYIPENGVDFTRFASSGPGTPNSPLRGAFVGRLVPYKGVDMLLKAAAEFLKEGSLELHIIGDGPERGNLETMARKLGFSNKVIFHGWIQHVDVHKKLRMCDFTVLPSIREFGGGVVIESMALGLPPIVADYGGPAELVDAQTGVRVAFVDDESLIHGITLALSNFIRFPGELRKFGLAGRKRVEENLTWEAKARQITAVYSAVLAGARDLRELSLHLSSGPKIIPSVSVSN